MGGLTTIRKSLVGFGVGGIVVVLATLVIGKIVMPRFDCASRWKDSGIEYRYTFRGGCQLKHGLGWIPASAYRVN